MEVWTPDRLRGVRRRERDSIRTRSGSHTTRHMYFLIPHIFTKITKDSEATVLIPQAPRRATLQCPGALPELSPSHGVPQAALAEFIPTVKNVKMPESSGAVVNRAAAFTH